jgi:hypothetical protein
LAIRPGIKVKTLKNSSHIWLYTQYESKKLLRSLHIFGYMLSHFENSLAPKKKKKKEKLVCVVLPERGRSSS